MSVCCTVQFVVINFSIELNPTLLTLAMRSNRHFKSSLKNFKSKSKSLDLYILVYFVRLALNR